jgi:hypothetical protein
MYILQNFMLHVMLYLMKRNVLVRVMCNVVMRKAQDVLYALQKIMISCIKAQRFYSLALVNFAPF